MLVSPEYFIKAIGKKYENSHEQYLYQYHDNYRKPERNNLKVQCAQRECAQLLVEEPLFSRLLDV